MDILEKLIPTLIAFVGVVIAVAWDRKFLRFIENKISASLTTKGKEKPIVMKPSHNIKSINLD